MGTITRALRRYRKEAPQRAEARRLRSKRRGMSDAEFQRRYDAQEGICPIGGHTMGPIGVVGGNEPVLDHNHQTGRDRSIICRNHNTGIGMFNDSISDLQDAITYLTVHNEN